MSEEIRFQTGFRGAPTEEPGLVMHLDGSVWLVAPDGSETPLDAKPGFMAFPFSFDMPDLNLGVPFFFPSVSQLLVDCWVEVAEVWDGTTPLCDFGSGLTSASGFFANESALIDMTVADSTTLNPPLLANASQKGSIFQVAAHNNSRVVPARFTTRDPLQVVVSSSGALALSAVCAPDALIALPLTVVAGVNDEFVFTGGGGGDPPETFTVASGVYLTVVACAEAMLAARGASNERFSTLCSTRLVFIDPDFVIEVAMIARGSAENGNTVSFGSHDVAADLGFTGNPDTFAGGSEGGDPGATKGSAVIYVATAAA